MPEMCGDSPIHPILPRAHEDEVIRLDYHHEPNDWQAGYLDLTLRRGDEVRRLRFLRPRGLKIEEGFPNSTGGMVILDVRHRQWQGVNVEVADFETSHGAITFYAWNVVDLDASEA